MSDQGALPPENAPSYPARRQVVPESPAGNVLPYLTTGRSQTSAPEFRQEGGQFVQKLRRPTPQVAPQVTPQVDSGHNLLKEQSLQELASALGLTIVQVTPQVTAQGEKVLAATANEARSREELQTATGMIDREHFRKTYIEPLVTAKWLDRTIPDKPTSRLQKYRLGAKGSDWLAGAMK